MRPTVASASRDALRESHDLQTQKLKRRAAMSPLKRSKSLAARMGRWSATHWKTAVFGWLAFVVGSVVLGIQLGTDVHRRA